VTEKKGERQGEVSCRRRQKRAEVGPNKKKDDDEEENNRRATDKCISFHSLSILIIACFYKIKFVYSISFSFQ